MLVQQLLKRLLAAALSNMLFVQLLMDNIDEAADVLKERLPDVGDLVVDIIVRAIKNAIDNNVAAPEVAAAFAQTLSPAFGSTTADSVSDLQAFGCSTEDCDCLRNELAD